MSGIQTKPHAAQTVAQIADASKTELRRATPNGPLEECRDIDHREHVTSDMWSKTIGRYSKGSALIGAGSVAVLALVLGVVSKEGPGDIANAMGALGVAGAVSGAVVGFCGAIAHKDPRGGSGWDKAMNNPVKTGMIATGGLMVGVGLLHGRNPVAIAGGVLLSAGALWMARTQK